MNEAFIWLSGLRFIDNNKLLMATNFFRIFSENKPVRGLRKKCNIPDVNNIVMIWTGHGIGVLVLDYLSD